MCVFNPLAPRKPPRFLKFPRYFNKFYERPVHVPNTQAEICPNFKHRPPTTNLGFHTLSPLPATPCRTCAPDTTPTSARTTETINHRQAGVPKRTHTTKLPCSANKDQRLPSGPLVASDGGSAASRHPAKDRGQNTTLPKPGAVHPSP